MNRFAGITSFDASPRPGGFTAAACCLDLSTKVSEQVQALEKALDVHHAECQPD